MNSASGGNHAHLPCTGAGFVPDYLKDHQSTKAKPLLKMVHPMQLEEQAKKKLEEFLQNVQNTDFLWLDEILEEAIKMFRNNSDGEPEMMPKTPSQKNRRKKRFSSVKKDSFSKKSKLEPIAFLTVDFVNRLSKRTATQSSKRISQQSQQKKDLEITKTDEDYNSPCRRVTRSQALKSARHSDAALKNSAIHLAKGRIPLVEISINERNSAEFQLNKTPPEKTALTFTLSSDKSPKRRSQALSKVSLLVVPDTPEAKIMKEGREACKLKIANASIARTTENKEANAQEENSCVQQHFTLETTQSISESPQTPTAPKANRHSVRRSLIGRNPKNCQASLVERCSLSAKRERMVQKSIGRTLSKRKTTQRSPSASRRMSSQTAMEKLVDEQISESGPELDPASHSQEASLTATATPREEQEGGDCKGQYIQACFPCRIPPKVVYSSKSDGASQTPDSNIFQKCGGTAVEPFPCPRPLNSCHGWANSEEQKPAARNLYIALFVGMPSVPAQVKSNQQSCRHKDNLYQQGSLLLFHLMTIGHWGFRPLLCRTPQPSLTVTIPLSV
ncbi:Inner centromere protein [Varanus komodoensis]|nr:Inner centromere protein [Varanus komodoensis]